MTSIDDILKENTFTEPRLVLFASDESASTTQFSQGFVVAEKSIVFEIDNISIPQAICSLIATYHIFFVNYPKAVPAFCLLMFIQEHLLGSVDRTIKKPAK